MNRLSDEKRARILACLTEGVSIRATARIVGVARGTVSRFLVTVGEFCSVYQNYRLRNLDCQRIQADELWAFVEAKSRNARYPHQGDIWTYTAMDEASRLMVTWLVGGRDLRCTTLFMEDLAFRVPEWVHLTTDGWLTYPEAVRRAFGHRVHYAQLIKNYGGDPDLSETERRYSPTVCTSTTKARVIGNPDMGTVSTSIVERANLDIRSRVRRFTRLTNGYSKKFENHAHAFSMYMMVYNFCRPHGALNEERGINTTPAMAAGLEERPWTVLEVVERMDGERMVFVA